MAKRGKKSEHIDDTTAENLSMKSLKSERFRFICGVIFLGFALFGLFAFVSYLFSWWVDFDVVSRRISFAEFLRVASEEDIRNVAGLMGARMAHVFIYNGFGITAFAFVWMAFAIGMKLLKIPIFKLKKTILHSTFFMVWGSIVFGFITLGLEKWWIFGGIFGFELAYYLRAVVGVPGFIFLLGSSLIVFLYVAYGVKFRLYHHMQNFFAKFKKDLQEEVDELLKEDETNVVVAETTDETITTDNDITDVQTGHAPSLQSDDDAFNLLEQIENQTDDGEVPFIIEDTSHSESETNGETDNDEEEIDEEPIEKYGIETPYDPYLDLATYKFPTLDLLEDYGMKNVDNSKQTDELIENKKLIENTLKSFGVEIAQIKATIGPTVTLY